eukprot:1115629-Heterocapsa_arctica.AAC.1
MALLAWMRKCPMARRKGPGSAGPRAPSAPVNSRRGTGRCGSPRGGDGVVGLCNAWMAAVEPGTQDVMVKTDDGAELWGTLHESLAISVSRQ